MYYLFPDFACLPTHWCFSNSISFGFVLQVGGKIQCTSCFSTFHPLCGRMAGVKMELRPGKNGNVDRHCLCPRHCKPQPHMSGVTRVKDEDVGDGLGLWNCQPYPPLPALPVPATTTGAARSQGLDRIKRANHGTGSGCTTLKVRSSFFVSSFMDGCVAA